MCNTTKETKEFFMFSYFGILPEEILKKKKEYEEFEGCYKKYIAYKCAYRAYRDVCRTIKYSVTTTQIDKNKTKYAKYKELKNTFINYEIELILGAIKSVPGTKKDFDVWHKTTCGDMTSKNTDEDKKEKIKNVLNPNYLFKKGCEFKYGMAQKWLNMTIKNLLLAEDMFNGCTGYGNILEENRAKFHVPVDKNILKAAKSLGINKILGKTYSIEGWSNWEEPTYTEFIRLLKDKLQKTSMLDWEHSAWMENAE